MGRRRKTENKGKRNDPYERLRRGRTVKMGRRGRKAGIENEGKLSCACRILRLWTRRWSKT